MIDHHKREHTLFVGGSNPHTGNPPGKNRANTSEKHRVPCFRDAVPSQPGGSTHHASALAIALGLLGSLCVGVRLALGGPHISYVYMHTSK